MKLLTKEDALMYRFEYQTDVPATNRPRPTALRPPNDGYVY